MIVLFLVECSVIMSSYGFDESQVRIGWRDRGVSFPESYDELEYIGFTWAPEQESIVATQVYVKRHTRMILNLLYIKSILIRLSDWSASSICQFLLSYL